MQNQNLNIWNSYYQSKKNILKYPDENIVRYCYKKWNNKKITILDLGCGDGRHREILENKQQNLVVSQDISLPTLEKQPNSILAMAGNLPYQNNSFDFVLSWGVLHYLKEDEVKSCISEVYRVLKTNGIFLLSVRSDQDTHLKKVSGQKDLLGMKSLFYSKKDVFKIMSPFKILEYGYMERNWLSSNKNISHHILECQK